MAASIESFAGYKNWNTGWKNSRTIMLAGSMQKYYMAASILGLEDWMAVMQDYNIGWQYLGTGGLAGSIVGL